LAENGLCVTLRTFAYFAFSSDLLAIKVHVRTYYLSLITTEKNMHSEIQKYHELQSPEDQEICNLLHTEITRHLPDAENKIWHAHPVWFLDGNPIVGYSKLKGGVRLLFWSGQTFEESGLKNEGSFKAAEARYTAATQINVDDLARWLQKGRDIQWDYKNIVKRRGVLERLK
jgi:hypothetical protein